MTKTENSRNGIYYFLCYFNQYIIDYWVGVCYCYRGTLLHEILANFFQIFEKSLFSALLI